MIENHPLKIGQHVPLKNGDTLIIETVDIVRTTDGLKWQARGKTTRGKRAIWTSKDMIND